MKEGLGEALMLVELPSYTTANQAQLGTPRVEPGWPAAKELAGGKTLLSLSSRFQGEGEANLWGPAAPPLPASGSCLGPRPWGHGAGYPAQVPWEAAHPSRLTVKTPQRVLPGNPYCQRGTATGRLPEPAWAERPPHPAGSSSSLWSPGETGAA